MLPIEFVVQGVPVSLQTRNRSSLATWKGTVATIAAQHWNADPLSEDIELRIVFYYDDSPPDVDNIVKPIQDALVGVVYEDDGQVTDVHSSLRSLNGAYRVRGLTPSLAQGFVDNVPFVHVSVKLAPDHRELLL